MAPKFKIKAREVNDLKKDLAKRAARSTNGPRWATRIPKDGELKVRFLANPNKGGWVEFQQVWDPAENKTILATEENEAEFNDRGLKPSWRYYAPALDIESGDTIVLELPSSLGRRLTALAEKKGKPADDLTSIDVSLYKTGEGKNTEYQADYEGADPIDLSAVEIPDLWKLLENRLAEETGVETDDEDDETIADEVVADDDEPPFEPDPPKAPVKKVVRRVVKKA